MDDKKSVVEALLLALVPLGPTTSKPMFGGFGVFFEGAMFAIVSSKGVVAFKADPINQQEFKGMRKFGKMPYYEVPESDRGDVPKLQHWAKMAIGAAQRAAKKKSK